MLDLGVYDLPRGTQVFTHDESKKIIQALNRLPAYANGVSRSGEVDRVVGQLNEQQSQTNINFDGLFSGAVFNVRNEQDVSKIAKKLHDYIRLNARKQGVIM